jgi:hypothetical protein
MGTHRGINHKLLPTILTFRRNWWGYPVGVVFLFVFLFGPSFSARSWNKILPFLKLWPCYHVYEFQNSLGHVYDCIKYSSLVWSTSGLETSRRKTLTWLVVAVARLFSTCRRSSGSSWARAFRWPRIGVLEVILDLFVQTYVVWVRVENFRILEIKWRKDNMGISSMVSSRGYAER